MVERRRRNLNPPSCAEKALQQKESTVFGCNRTISKAIDGVPLSNSNFYDFTKGSLVDVHRNIVIRLVQLQ